MKRQLFPLFCVGAVSASAGPLISALLTVAVAPDIVALRLDPRAAEPLPPMLDGRRLAQLLQLEPKASSPSSPFQRYRLRGTLAPVWASVEPTEGGRTRSVGVGDALDDATVEEVGHGFLLVRRGDGLTRLTVNALPGAAPPPSSATRTLEISRRELDDARSRIFELGRQVGWIPAYEAGAAVGFRVAWLAPNALALRAGLQQGDVVTAVNGHSLTDLDQLTRLAKEVTTETHFTADIVRGGAPIRLEVKAL